ncbi:MAG: hypothetical protein ACK5EK_02835 [Flavobacteriia bacterium]|jgi:hypothetical protein
MKKSLFAFTLMTVLFFNQLSAQSDAVSPHNGFNASLTVGSSFGKTRGSTGDFGTMYYRGSRMNMKMQLGYSYSDWAVGLSFGMNSLFVSSIEVSDTAYSLTEDVSMDDGLIGLYVKKYFMPLNIYACADLGISNFKFYDSHAELQGNTDRGFSWSISAGKEFLIGKKKRFGLGAYVSLSGIKCNDLPPYEKDTYSHVLPGLGATISYH